MLAANQIPAENQGPIVLMLAQLSFQQGDYTKAAQYYERFLKDNPDRQDVLEELTTVYFKKGDYKNTIENAQKIIKHAEQAKKPIAKDWLVMLRFSYFKLENNAGVSAVTEQLLSLYPSAEYWTDILKVVKSESNFSDKESIEFYRLKKAIGVMSAAEYNEMAELSLSMTDPGDAKAALEAGISSGVIKADERTNRLLTKAKADAATDLTTLDSVAKEAAAKPTGDALAKVGAAYLGHGQYEKAADTIQRAIAKGKLTTAGALDQSYIRLGVAKFHLGKKAEAIKAFQSVSANSKLARLAKLWVIYANGNSPASAETVKK